MVQPIGNGNTLIIRQGDDERPVTMAELVEHVRGQIPLGPRGLAVPGRKGDRGLKGDKGDTGLQGPPGPERTLPSTTAIASTVIPADVLTVRTLCRATPGDQGGATLAFTPTPPATPGPRHVRSANGRWFRIVEAHRPLQALGVGDTSQGDNAPALAAAADMLGPDALLPLPKVGTGVYNFVGFGDLKSFILQPDPGVILRGNVGSTDDIRTLGDIRIEYNDGTIAEVYTATRTPREATDPVRTFAPPPNPERLFNPGAGPLALVKLTWPNGTGFAADTTVGSLPTTGGLAGNTAVWTLPASGPEAGFFRAALLPAFGDFGFRDLTWNWQAPAASALVAPSPLAALQVVGCAIKCSNGWIVVGGAQDQQSLFVRTYVAGDVHVETSINGWDGVTDHNSWRPGNATWSVRALTPYSFQLCLNKAVIKVIFTNDAGWIEEIGPAVYNAGTTDITVHAANMWVRESAVARGGRVIGLLTSGDSNGDEKNEPTSPGRYTDTWAQNLRHGLEGQSGIRIRRAFSIAKGGQTIQQQLQETQAFLAGPNADEVQAAVIVAGANDGQNQRPAAAIKADLSELIDRWLERNAATVVAIPHEFYSRALAASYTGVPHQGQDTRFSDRIAYVRGVIAETAIAKGVGLVDAAEAIGPELANWLQAGYFTEPDLRDGIHGTRLFGPKLAHRIVEALLRQLTPPFPRSLPGLKVTSQHMRAGFTPDAAAHFEVIDGATAALNGEFTRSGGTWSNGIVAIPRGLAPAQEVRWIADDLSGVTLPCEIGLDHILRAYPLNGLNPATLRLRATWPIGR